MWVIGDGGVLVSELAGGGAGGEGLASVEGAAEERNCKGRGGRRSARHRG